MTAPFMPGIDHYYQAGTGVRKFPAVRRRPTDPDPWVAQCETEEGAREFADHLNQCVQDQKPKGKTDG